MRAFGKYVLVEPLASGGMADVWRAQVTGPEGVVKEVALKLVRGEHAAKSDFVRMFVQEARFAARLGHANVVQVFEFDQIDGRYYLAMELVRGRHLGQVVERARERGVRLGLARAVHVGVEVARGLAYAHRLSDGGRRVGLVHRDVSPHNVLVSFEGEVKLADFGIARAMNQDGLTEPGTLKGKLAYMAPEQARSGALDARADVFSLGVVVWELCAGRRLFARDSEAAILAAVTGDAPISPPSAWNEEVPPELDAAVLGALARDPERRTATADDLAVALAGVLLRIARSPDDLDLRAFMQRIFEGEIARAAGGSAASDATVVRGGQGETAVRPVALAREPVAAAPGQTRSEEQPTRTAAPSPRPRRRALVAGVAAVGGMAAALLLVRGGRPAPGGIAGAAEPPVAQATAPSGRRPPPGGEAGASDAAAVTLEAATPVSTGARVAPPADVTLQAAVPVAAGARLAPPADAPARAAQPPPGAPRPLSAHALGRLRVPPRESGEGILSVNATPWGTVTVDGLVLGETPQEVRLPAGPHRVRIERPNHRAVEADVTVIAGRRTNHFR